MGISREEFIIVKRNKILVKDVNERIIDSFGLDLSLLDGKINFPPTTNRLCHPFGLSSRRVIIDRAILSRLFCFLSL